MFWEMALYFWVLSVFVTGLHTQWVGLWGLFDGSRRPTLHAAADDENYAQHSDGSWWRKSYGEDGSVAAYKPAEPPRKSLEAPRVVKPSEMNLLTQPRRRGRL